MATKTANKSTFVAGAKRRYKFWMLTVVLFFGWATYTFIEQLEQHKATHSTYIDTRSQLEAAQAESVQLQIQIDKLNDPEYISQLATKQQGMLKAGEKQIFSD